MDRVHQHDCIGYIVDSYVPWRYLKMKIQVMNDRQYFITLPNKLVKAKNWERGDELKIELNNKGDLVILKVD